MSEQTQVTETAKEEGSTTISVQDLAVMKVIIETSQSRGAFKPEEMVAVGQTYAKLAAFLDAVTKASAETDKKEAQ